MLDSFRMKTEEEKWLKLHRIWCFGVFLYYMLWRFSSDFFGKLFATYFITAAIVMVAFCVWFRRFRDGWETKLLGIFWIWFCIAKIANGDRTLGNYYYLIITLAVCYCFLPVGITAAKEQREKVLDWFSFAIGFFYAGIGTLSLYSMVSGNAVVNPFSGDILTQVQNGISRRLMILGNHLSSTGSTFFVALSLMIYQFFHCRRRAWRVPIVLAFLEFYLCIGATFSRSNMGAVAVCMAMAVILLVLQKIPREKKTACVMTVVLATVIVTSFVYMSFSWSTGVLGQIAASIHKETMDSGEITETNEIIEKISFSELATRTENNAESPAAEEPDEDLFRDNRSLETDIKSFSHRKELYQAVFVTFKAEPRSMLTGSNVGNMLRYADEIRYGSPYYYHYEHMHNFLLQVLMLTGIPGFILVLAFCVLLLIRMVRVFFSERLSIAEKTLVLPLAGLLIYYMLEAGLFTETGVQTLFFFLIAGMVIGIDNTVKN